MKRALAVAAALLACRTPPPEPPSAEELRALPRALAGVADDLGDVEVAGSIELRAMEKALALASRMEEPELRARSGGAWTREALLSEPGAFRGDVIFVNGLVAQLVPVGGLTVAILMSVPDRTLFAFALPDGTKVREGQMVWESGFFFKRWVLKTPDGRFVSCPLGAGSFPTRSGGRFPAERALNACGLGELFPLAPAGGAVRARLVLVAPLGPRRPLGAERREGGEVRFEGKVVKELNAFLRARKEESVVLRRFASTPAEAVAGVEKACKAAGKMLIVVEILAE